MSRYKLVESWSLLLWLTLSTAVAGAPQGPNEPFTTQEGTWISLDVAPDGRTIAFELLGDIYVLPSQGGKARPILTGRPFQSQPRFSPDGAQLVFVSDETGSDNVWIAGADGSDPRALTALSGPKLLSPAWTADGSSVLVTVITSQGFSSFAEIWRYDASSGEGERLVENQNGPSARLVSAPAPGAYGPIPSPDGESVYFTSVTPRQHGQRGGASSSVMRLDLGSGAIDRVAVQGTNAMKPAISRDGERLVYAAMKEGRTGLKLREFASGSERWLVYPMQRNQLEARATRDVLPNFAIAPDGDSVLLEWNGRIHRVGLDEASDQVVPFEAQVNLATEPRLNFPRRVDTGPVRVRRVQQLAVSSTGHSAISAAARIWVLAPGEDRPHRLTAAVRPREFMPAWSADSQWLGAVPPDAHLVVVSASNGESRSLGPAEGSRRPHFGPDDGEVFVSATAGLAAVDLSGGARRIAARLPEGAGPTDLRLSPDGASVLAE
jgi:Tol biopolymer transport system component